MRSEEYYKNYAQHFWKKVSIGNEFECWPFKMSPNTKRRYGWVVFMGDGCGSHIMAFRLANSGIEIKPGMMVCHTCDNTRCCNPQHLFLGTNSDNQIDSSIKGRMPSKAGEKNWMAKLTKIQVEEIRNLHASGIMQKELATQFKVSRAAICLIVNRKHWN